MNFKNNNQNSILLVEDDTELANLISEFLRGYNFKVDIISNGYEAVRVIQEIKPDLVILDIMLPDINGMDVCRMVRKNYDGYILIQTALDDDADQMTGLEIGADDYIIKKVKPQLLLSRINALLRRSTRNISEKSKDSLTCGPLKICMNRRTVEIDNVQIEMTSAEFELLVLLARSVGKVVCREEIVKKIRGFEYDGLDRAIDRRVSRLRNRLKVYKGTELIKTVRGVGYQLCIYTEREDNV